MRGDDMLWRLGTGACIALLAGCQLIVGFDDPVPLRLESLQLTGAVLDPPFDPATTQYAATMTHGDTVPVRPRATDPDVMIDVSNAAVAGSLSTKSNDMVHDVPVQAGLNRISIRVRTQEGVEITYAVDTMVPGVRLGTPSEVPIVVPPPPRSIKTVDFDGDGTPDVAVCSFVGVTIVDVAPGSVLATAGSSQCSDFAIADLDAQHGPDLVVVSGGTAATVFTRSITGNFDPPQPVSSGQQLVSVALGDLDGDANLDLVLGDAAGNPTNGRTRWALGTGGGGFGSTFELIGTGGVQATLVVGALDSVAGGDVMVLDGNGPAITLLRGDGAGGLERNGATPTNSMSDPMSAQSLVTLNADVHPVVDYAAVHVDTNELVVVRNYAGDETLTSKLDITTFPTEPGPRAVTVADLDRDGHDDLIVSCHDGNTLEVFYGDGAGAFRPVRFDIQAPVGAAVGDFNGDALLDIAVISETGVLSVFTQEAIR